jgi:sugar phosphate isomerase/epimerase
VIKISAMIGTPELEKAPVAIYKGDLATAFGKVADLGYDGVELMVKAPRRLDGEAILRLMDRYDLALAGLCSGQVYGEDGLGLVGLDADMCRRAMQRMQELVDFAALFGEGAMVNIGRSRGMGDESDMAGTWQRAVAVFRELSDYALARRVRLTLEPLNHYEINYILTTKDGLAMVRDVNRPNFGLMLDTYHMNIEDADIYDSFREARQYCWHIHFADNNRKWPGNAHLDFPAIVEVLQEIEYDGFVSAEILPWPDPDIAARSTINYLRRYIPKVQCK